jgi:hypothetical protein
MLNLRMIPFFAATAVHKYPHSRRKERQLRIKPVEAKTTSPQSFLPDKVISLQRHKHLLETILLNPIRLIEVMKLLLFFRHHHLLARTTPGA